MAPKLGDMVFVRVTNPNTGEFHVEPALVTQTTSAADGEWAQDGNVVGIRSFGPEGVDIVGEQQGPATYDDNGVWNGGYALTSDGEEVQSLDKAPVVAPSAENPTVQAGGGVSTAQVQAMISAGNADLLKQLQATMSGQNDTAQGDPAPADHGDANPDTGHSV